MSLFPNQEQNAGDNSTNIQAENVHIGITAAEARQIALDVYKSNALDLIGEAKQIAQDRVEKLTDEFLKQLNQDNPSAISAANDPDFLNSIFEAQKAFARTGDKETGDVLIDLLCNRAASSEKRNTAQIVLNEAIATIGKLSNEHLAIIALIFCVRYVSFQIPNNNIVRLAQNYDRLILPFSNIRPPSETALRHLSYTGAANVEITSLVFEEIYKQTYPGIFSKGIAKSALDPYIARDARVVSLIDPDSKDDKIYLLAVTNPALDEMGERLGIDQGLIDELKAVQLTACLENSDIEKMLAESSASIDKLRSTWNTTLLNKTNLTPVGLALGHGFLASKGLIKQKESPLSIWIPED